MAKSQAYYQGRHFARNGIEGPNPYPELSEAWNDFEDGWGEVQAELIDVQDKNPNHTIDPQEL